jgi:hypothetical protein
MNAATQQRRRHDQMAAAIDRAESPPGSGAESILVKTIAVGTYPTTAKAMYAVVGLKADCDAAEGSTPTFTAAPDALKFFALNVGTTVPPAGTQPILCDLIDGIWCFRHDG